MAIVDQEKLPFPRVLRIEPASQCNLECTHCPTGTVAMERGLMSPEIFARVLEEVERNREAIKVIVLYHGGEPLLNRKFYHMIESLREIDESFFIKTVSNGMALTRKHAEDIVRSGIDSIEISLDGVSPEESQYIREKSSTARVIANVKALLEIKRERGSARPDVHIATTQFIRSREEIGKTGDTPRAAWIEEEFRGLGIASIKATYGVHWPHYKKGDNYDVVTADGEDLDECDHVINTITVRADGAVVPCCYDLTSKLVMGNINDSALIDIWNGEKYRALRRSINCREYISICSNCAVVRPPRYLIPRWHTAPFGGSLKKDAV